MHQGPRTSGLGRAALRDQHGQRVQCAITNIIESRTERHVLHRDTIHHQHTGAGGGGRLRQEQPLQAARSVLYPKPTTPARRQHPSRIEFFRGCPELPLFTSQLPHQNRALLCIPLETALLAYMILPANVLSNRTTRDLRLNHGAASTPLNGGLPRIGQNIRPSPLHALAH